MSRRDDQFGEPGRTWLEVVGRNIAGTCSITAWEKEPGVESYAHATVGLNAGQLLALADRLAREAKTLDTIRCGECGRYLAANAACFTCNPIQPAAGSPEGSDRNG